MYTNILQLDMLSCLIYLPLNEKMIGKTVFDISDSLSKNLDEEIFYNRLYSQNLSENVPKPYNKKYLLSYSMFKDETNPKNKSDILIFLNLVKNDNILSQFELIYLYDNSEKFTDKYDNFLNRKTGNKIMCVYNKFSDEYIFVIRGTNGDIQWLDNAKTIDEKYTTAENEAYEKIYDFYMSISKYTLKNLVITGHSKGGLTALMVGAKLYSMGFKRFKVHSLYSPYINNKRISNTIGDNITNITAFMQNVTLEIHVADVVSNLFLSEKIIYNDNKSVYFVGSFDDNSTRLLKNHEPLRRFVKNGVIVRDKWYDERGIPKTSNDEKIFSRIICRLSEITLEEDILISYPFIVALMKKYKLIGAKSKKDFFENEYLMNLDFKNTIKNTDKSLKFSFSTIKNDKSSLYSTYLFILKILNDRILSKLLLNFFSNDDILKGLYKNYDIRIIVKKFMTFFISSKINKDNQIFKKISYENFTYQNMLYSFLMSIHDILSDESGLNEINKKNDVKIVKKHFGNNHFFTNLIINYIKINTITDL